MKTFAISVTLDSRVTVTDDFVKALRNASVPHPEDLTFQLDPFLAAIGERYADNDDEFVKAVLANGIRKMTRLGLVDNLHNSGVVATVAPATVQFYEEPEVELAQEKRAELASIEQAAEAKLDSLLADLPGPSAEVLAEAATYETVGEDTANAMAEKLVEIATSPVEPAGVDLLGLTATNY